MTLTLYEISVPVLLDYFTQLTNFLKKAESHAASSSTSAQTLAESKLFEDMGNLIFQVQRASDIAKFLAVRVGGVDNVPWEDNEKTFEDVYARIDKTVAFLKSVKPEQINGKEETDIFIVRGESKVVWSGKEYVSLHALPNFFFHVVTAYDILRNQGVPVGKKDYIKAAKTA
jgi:hypothetical protein